MILISKTNQTDITILEKGYNMLLILFLITLRCNFANAKQLELTISSFDTSLYENSLDAVECEKQLSFIQRNLNLRFQFLDAGLRIPKFINQGNNLDLGNYHGCLGIHQTVDNSTTQGKYCMINLPTNQNLNFSDLTTLKGFSEMMIQNDTISDEAKENRQLIDIVKRLQEITVGISNISRSETANSINTKKFRIAVCIPKPCTISKGISGLLNNAKSVGFQYEEEFCRLPDDKPWVTADFIAIVLFSLIGILTIISTFYDLRNQFIFHVDPKSVSPLYTSFSVYTNACRLTTFNKNPNNLDCVDGVRALSMTWIILCHIFAKSPVALNITEYRSWELSLQSIWMTSAPLAVDTFLMMSGMLLVYSKAGKLTGSKLMRNLHLFYLNRIIRMFPLLAAAILMQASFFHWISDGPLWQKVALATDSCRNYWWLNLLYVNNFFTPMCISVSWYVAVDMQLHILSPILLYFVLSNSKRQAWVALVGGLLVVQIAATIFVFIKQLPGATIQPGRIEENYAYGGLYYLNTLPRAAPFFIGMLFGYILHLNRQPKLNISKRNVLILWCLIIIVGSMSFYSPEPMKDVNHNNQIVDSFVNAFAKSAWALAVACLILMCINGYGGPVNWFLSLQLWKLISRISYAMYLFHYPLIILINSSCVQPTYFSVSGTLYGFLSIFSLSFIVGFVATLVIDSPFSTIFNRLLGGSKVV